MTQLYLFEKEKVMKNKDYVAIIMQEWYEAMDKANVQVQPKTSTLLGQILTKYDVQPKHKLSKEEIFAQYMNTKAGDWEVFWSGLSPDEKEYIESRRQKLRDEYYSKRNLVDDNAKTLLKG
tara:strand:+ start:68 stop:430 length:363 start_codon:yes stop_codon:yes gene_type:complete